MKEVSDLNSRAKIGVSNLDDKVGYILVFLTSLIVMVFINRFSLLFSSFTAQDINVYSDIGRAAMHGKVLYKDVFDHKGPAFLMLYGIFGNLSDHNYLGQWILFFISTFAFYLAVYKSTRLFSSAKTAYLSVPLAALLIYLKKSYYISCGTPEELFLPLYMWMIYGLLRCAKPEELSERTKMVLAAFLGVTTSFIFLAKMNLTLFPALASIYVFVSFWKCQKSFPVKQTIAWVGGFLLIVLPIFIYMLCTHSYHDFIEAYFRFNAGYASDGKKSQNLVASLINAFLKILFHFPIHYIILIGGLLAASMKKLLNSEMILIFFLLGLSAQFSELSSGRAYFYSILPLIPFVCVSLSFLISLLDATISKCVPAIVSVVGVLLSVVCVFENGAIWKSRIVHPEKSGMQILAEKIEATYNKEGNPQILQYGYSADGIYTFTNTYPEFFYFYTPGDSNDYYEYIEEEQISYLEEGRADYCVCTSLQEAYDWKIEQFNEHYVLIAKVEQKNEDSVWYISLYQLAQ